MLQKQHRLTRRRDFKALYAGGRTYVHRLLVLKVLESRPEQPSRFGFVTSAKLGNSVSRNRTKRIFREAVRLLLDGVRPMGRDVVLIARPTARGATFAEVSQAVQELLRKAGPLRCRDEVDARRQSP